MKYRLGGSLFQIAVAAMEITILISNTKNVPTRAFRALPNNVEIVNDSEMAALIQIIKIITMGPGLIETISSWNAAAASKKINMDENAEMKKSTYLARKWIH